MRMGVYVPLEVEAMTILKRLSDRSGKPVSRVVDAFIMVLLEELPPKDVNVDGVWGSQTLSLDFDRWQQYNQSIVGYYRPRAVLSWAIRSPVYLARVEGMLIEPPMLRVQIPLSPIAERSLQLRLSKAGKTADQLIGELLSAYLMKPDHQKTV